MSETTTATRGTVQLDQRAAMRRRLRLVTDSDRGIEYLVRAKTNAAAIAAVTRHYVSRLATAEDIDARRDCEVIDADEQDDARGDLLQGGTP